MTLTVESWCEALESGKYKQGESELRTLNNEFCCLGVACDLYDPAGWTDNGEYEDSADSNYSALTPLVQDALGVAGTLGSFRFTSLPTDLQEEILNAYGSSGSQPVIQDLADLNDNGIPFPLIAKVIRARPKGLFREDKP